MRVYVADALLAIGAVTTLGFMLYAGEPDVPLWWPVALVIAAWCVVPYGVLARTSRRMADDRLAAWTIVAVSALWTLIAVATLYTTFITYSDAQGGLVFLFLPIWQAIVAVPFLAAYRFFVRPVRR